MEQTQREAYKLAFTLKEQGKSWAEITQALKDKGHVNRQGRPFPKATLRKEYSTCKKDRAQWLLVMGEEPQSERDADSPTIGEARMREIAAEVCQEFIQNVRNELKAEQIAPRTMGLDVGDLPEPKKTGRKENRLYLKLAVTTDLVLADRLIALAKQQKCSVGRMLDRILWEVFDRPALTNELSGEALSPLEERHKAALEKLKSRGKAKLRH
jgi:hypothetical protein